MTTKTMKRDRTRRAPNPAIYTVTISVPDELLDEERWWREEGDERVEGVPCSMSDICDGTIIGFERVEVKKITL